MKKISLFILSVIILTACTGKGTVQINGTIENMSNGTLVLKIMQSNNLEVIDSIRLDENGSFVFNAKLDQP